MALVKTKNLVIIDTDCGIDDAMAILLALSDNQNTEVLAITCCGGNTKLENVCSNVMRVLVICNKKEIPVYRGSGMPLVHSYALSTVFHGSDGLGNTSTEFSTEDMKVQEIHAVNALINLTKSQPQKITLIALGPLTNIALAQRLDPSFSSNLKELVLLGGNYKGIGNTISAAEFNFHFDPEAAHVVMTESDCAVSMVPWETVLEHGVEWEEFREFLESLKKYKTKRARFLERLLCFAGDMFSKEDSKFYDCDLLGVAAVVCPESVVSSIHFPVTVECSGNYTRGQAVVERRSEKNKKINIITRFNDDIIKNLRLKMAGIK